MHEKKLHIWRIILVLIILILIVLITLFLYKNHKVKNAPYYKETYHYIPRFVKIESSDKAFSLRVNEDYTIKKLSSEKHVLNIYTDDGFSILATKIKKYNFDLLKIIESEKTSFLEHLGEYSNLTDLVETKYKNISGYSYSLQIKNDEKNFEVFEFITEINENLYFFDIIYPTKFSKEYKELADELLNSITIN